MDRQKRPRVASFDAQAPEASYGASTPKSRLTRACAKCKQHKIKCDVQPGQTSCNRCLRSGTVCEPYNFAQKFIDEDTTWKAQATSSLNQLKAAVQYLLNDNGLPELAKFVDGEPLSPQLGSAAGRQITGISASSPGTIDPSSSVATEQGSGLVPPPMSNLYSLTEATRLDHVLPSAPSSLDFVGRGVVSITEAESLYAHYRENINGLLWAGVLCQHATLQEARQSSSLLVAAILTVAALHAPGRKDSLHAVYEEFVSLSASMCLSRTQNLDDIRGLCIGAFYLTNLSWRLCSQAVRIATELNLHRAPLSLLRGYTDVQSHERVRLWYVLYICDHQLAIAYGRPPLMHDDAAIKEPSRFLANQHATPGDIRLTGQVRIQQLLAEVYFLYGCDPGLQLEGDDYERLRSSNIAVDQWRLAWVSRSVDMPVYGSYPSRSKVLYYHFARFHINSLSLRGLSAHRASNGGSTADLSWDRREAANSAISAASSTLKLVNEEEDIKRALVGVPIFTHSMIAMCASFLIKLVVAFGSPEPVHHSGYRRVLVPGDLSSYGLSLHTADALFLVKQLVGVLGTVAEKVSQRHLACHIVMGLKELLQHFTPSTENNGFIYSRLDYEQAVAIVNHGLLPSRPTSGSGNLTDPPPQNRSLNDVDQDQTNTNIYSGAFDGFSDDHDSTLVMGTLDWVFDEGLLWQTDGQDTFC